MTKVPDLSPARRDTVAVEVARNLLRYILSEDVRPGDRLPSERALAESAGVGRSAIREALKSLSLLGLVDVRQGDGTYVRTPDSELLPRVLEWGLLLGEKRVDDLVEARRHLEVITAGLAATRRSEESLVALRAEVERLAAAGTDIDRFVEADIAFHAELARAAGNTAFQNILSSVHGLLLVWIRRTLERNEDFSPYVEEHRRIVEAVERRDAAGASAAMMAHMDAALSRLAAAFPNAHPTEGPAPAPDPVVADGHRA